MESKRKREASPPVKGATPQRARGRRPRRTQAERTAESERRILRAAGKLIGQRGYRGTSIAAIGAEAGYSRGLVNERFGSKAGLLMALVKRMLNVWASEGKGGQSPGCAGVDALCSLLDNHRRAVEKDEGLTTFYALMFEALGPMPELLEEFQSLHRCFRSDIEQTLREGMCASLIRRDIDPESQAAIILGSLRGIAFQWLLDREGFAVEAAYEELKRNLRRSLEP